METTKKVLVGALVLLLLTFAWKRAWRAMASEEERIQARLESMVDGFHSTTLRHVLSGFHHDFHDTQTFYDREVVADALRYMFFQERDSVTRRFPFRIEIPPDELAIVVREDETTADVKLHAIFHRSVGGKEELYWDMTADLVFVKDKGKWSILESNGVNHRDRQDAGQPR